MHNCVVCSSVTVVSGPKRAAGNIAAAAAHPHGCYCACMWSISCRGHVVGAASHCPGLLCQVEQHIGRLRVCLGVMQSAISMHVDGFAALLSSMLQDSAFMGHNVTCTMSLFDLIKYGRHACCPRMTCAHHTLLFLLRPYPALLASIPKQSPTSPSTADSSCVEALLHCVRRQCTLAGSCCVWPPLLVLWLMRWAMTNVWQTALQRELLGTCWVSYQILKCWKSPSIWVWRAVNAHRSLAAVTGMVRMCGCTCWLGQPEGSQAGWVLLGCTTHPDFAC